VASVVFGSAVKGTHLMKAFADILHKMESKTWSWLCANYKELRKAWAVPNYSGCLEETLLALSIGFKKTDVYMFVLTAFLLQCNLELHLNVSANKKKVLGKPILIKFGNQAVKTITLVWFDLAGHSNFIPLLTGNEA